MDALLVTASQSQAETGEGGQQAAGDLPVIQEALAEAAGESFVDHLIGQFAQAEQLGGDSAGSDATDTLHAALSSMLAGTEMAQASFEPMTAINDMEAMAAASV